MRVNGLQYIEVLLWWAACMVTVAAHQLAGLASLC